MCLLVLSQVCVVLCREFRWAKCVASLYKYRISTLIPQ